MQNNSLPYAIALFELSTEENKVNVFLKNSELVLQVISEDYRRLINSPFLTKDKKIELIKKVFAKKVDGLFLKFLSYLVVKNSFYYVEEILEEFSHLVEKLLNIKRATVYSSHKLTLDEIKKIHAALEQKTKTKIKIEYQIDPTLISGIKIKTHGEIFDYSVKRKINDLRSSLLER